MPIKVKLFATLRQGRFIAEDIDYVSGITVKQIIDSLKIPDDEVAIIFLNSKHAELDQTLVDGDTLSLFPPIGGG